MSTPVLSGNETSPAAISVSTSAGSTTNPYDVPAVLTVTTAAGSAVRVGTATSGQGGKAVEASTSGVEIAIYDGGASVNMRADGSTTNVLVTWSEIATFR